MAKRKTSSAAQKIRYKVYADEMRSHKNRVKNLKRHIERFPNDEQAKRALKNGIVTYRRKTPRNNRTWSPESIRFAQMLKKCGIKGHHALSPKELLINL